MHCCLWFRSVFRVRGPWPKRYGYHLSLFVWLTVLFLCTDVMYISIIIIITFNYYSRLENVLIMMSGFA